MVPEFILIVILHISVAIAYPGKCTAKTLQMWFAKTVFKFSPMGGAKQILLDNFYVEYFAAETEQLGHKWALQIATFTHIYLLQCKIGQNKREMEGMGAKRDKFEEGTEGKAATVYEQFTSELAEIGKNVLENAADDAVLCRLLQLKHETFKHLRLKVLGHCTKKPNCANASAVQQTISENRQQIAEWLLSDLLHYLPERHRLIQYFGDISKRNNADEIHRTWTKFADLLGVQRAAMLWAVFIDKMCSIGPSDLNAFFALIYNEYFTNANSVLAKLRSKLILDAGHYNEWASNFFAGEHQKIASEERHNGHKCAELKMKKNFLNGLLADWKAYQGAFWHHEMMIKESVDFYAKNFNKFGQFKQILADVQGRENSMMMMLWEGGPDSANRILLFNPLAICTKKAVAEYNAKFGNTKLNKLEELNEKTSQNLLKCVSRLMRTKSSQMKDEFVAKLHFGKLAKFIDDDVISEQLGKMLTRKHQLLNELMHSDDVNKLRMLYQQNHAYFSPPENFISSDEENFYDATDDALNDGLRNLNEGNLEGKNLNKFSKTNEKLITKKKSEKIEEKDIKLDKNSEITQKEMVNNKNKISEEISNEKTANKKNNNKFKKEKKKIDEFNCEKSKKSLDENSHSAHKKTDELPESGENSEKNSELSEKNSSKIFDENFHLNLKSTDEMSEMSSKMDESEQSELNSSEFSEKNSEEFGTEIFGMKTENILWTEHSQYKKEKGKKLKKIYKRDRGDRLLGEEEEEGTSQQAETKCQTAEKPNLNLSAKSPNADTKCRTQKKGKGDDKSQTTQENLTELVKDKGKHPNDVKIDKKVKYSNSCTRFLGQLGINKFADLIDELSVSKLLNIYHKNGAEHPCAKYLVISVFARAIEANFAFGKFCHENYAQKEMGQFEKSWTTFVDTELDEFDGTQFLSEKLFFVLNELVQFAFDSSKNECIEKATAYMDEPQMKQIGKRKINLERKTDKNSPNAPQKTEANDEQKSSQFGLYSAKTFTLMHSLLQSEILFLINAKNKIAKWENERQNLARSKEKMDKNLLQCYESTRKMLTMQNLDVNYSREYSQIPTLKYEMLQYNLIRCDTVSRGKEISMSREMGSFISMYALNNKNKKAIFFLRSNIARLIYAWAKKEVRIVSNGSYLLGAELAGSDLDLICFAPNDINAYKFYGEGPDSLSFALKAELSAVANILVINGLVKLIKIEHSLTNIDLTLVPVPRKCMRIQNSDFESDQIMQRLTFASGILSLAGFRSAKYLLQNVPNQNLFTSLLKIVKIWTKTRLIESSIFGYLNGTALAVMAAKICIIYPNAPLIYLCQQFFAVYSKWDWPNVPVLLDELSPVSLNELAHLWPPKLAEHPMTVITPRFPEQNATFNVNKNTREVIVEELNIAHQILSANVQNWRAIFVEVPMDSFGHFALIVCASNGWDGHVANCGFQKSKIRQQLLEWAELEGVAKRLRRYRAIPRYEQRLVCKETTASNAESIIGNAVFCTLWLVGLNAHEEFDENFSDNLSPIYRNDAKNKSVSIQSIFTDPKNLNKTIDNLIFKGGSTKK